MAVDLESRPDAGSDERNPGQIHAGETVGGASLFTPGGGSIETKGGLRKAEEGAGGSDGGLFNAGGDKSRLGGAAAGIAGVSGAAGLGITALGKLKGIFLGSSRRKKTTLGGAIAGLLVGGGFFGLTVVSGPLEFIHIAQLLTQFHFSTMQDESDSRFLQLERYARFTPKGETYRTNLGVLGNHYADIFEAKLQSQGLTSQYTKYLGFKTGYNVDTNHPEFKNLEGEQLKSAIETKFPGSTVTLEGRSATLTPPKGYLASKGFTRNVLKGSGDSRLTASVGARLLGQRDGLTWHPLKKLDNALYGTLEKKILEWQKRKANEDKGITDPDAVPPSEDTATQPAQGNTEQQQTSDNAQAAQTEAQATTAEGKQVEDKINTGGDSNGKALSTFTDHITAKLTGGVAAAAGVLCLARGIALDSGNIKEAQTVLPLARMGMRIVSEGNQVMSNQDFDINQLGLDSQQFYDAASKTTWNSAESIQAEEGKNVTNSPASTKPDSTLKTLSSGTPLDFLVSGTAISSALNGVCGQVGSAIQTIIGFAGGPFSFLGGTLLGAIGGKTIIPVITKYLAGDVIDPNVKGAAFGNDINYGARIAANDQAVSEGGSALTTTQEAVLNKSNQHDANIAFKSHNLAYKLFSPTDNKSVLASLIDNESSSFSFNVTSFASSLLNTPHALGTVFSGLLNLKAHAATTSTSYNYGFPAYGFSATAMDETSIQNPYQNGEDVATLLDTNSTQAQAYEKMVSSCFGDQLVSTPGNSGQNVWDVQFGTSSINTFSQSYKTISGQCSSDSDSNWVKVRFFVFDTENMKSAACYQGDSQSCSDVGFGASTTPSSTSGGGTIDQGTPAQLATKLLGYRSSGKYSCDNPGDCADLTKVVNGQSLAGSDGCQAQTLDPRVMQLLLYLIESGNYTIGTYAMCGDHSYDSSKGHAGGFAVDISTINGVSINTDSSQSKTNVISLDKFLNNLPASLKLNQQISYGYGNHYDADVAALQQAQGTLCTNTCVSFYTQAVEGEHENHVHAGF